MTKEKSLNKNVKVQEYKSEFSKRLQKVVDHLGGPKKSATILGVSETSLFGYLAGKNEPKSFALLGFDDEGINISWLLTGKGDMLLNEQEKPLDDGYILLPRYDIEAAAGNGMIPDNEKIRDYLSFKESWLKSAGIDKNNALLLRTTGDSMEPTIAHGSTVLLDTSAKNIVDNGIYVFESASMVRIKRFRSKIEGLEIISDNPIYPAELVKNESLNNIRIIGRVRWFGSYA